ALSEQVRHGNAAETATETPEKFTAAYRGTVFFKWIHKRYQFKNINSLLFKMSRQVLAMPCFLAYSERSFNSFRVNGLPIASCHDWSICLRRSPALAPRGARCSLCRIMSALFHMASACSAVIDTLRTGVNCDASAQSMASMNGSGMVRKMYR